jgi:hypothetical protein
MFAAARRVILAFAGKPSDGTTALSFCIPNGETVADHVTTNAEAFVETATPKFTPVPNNPQVEIITLPYLVSDTAMLYPGQETDTTFTLKTQATVKGYTLSQFSNQQRAAFKAAYAKSVGVDPATGTCRIDTKELQSYSSFFEFQLW